MPTWRLILKEVWFRKLNFSLSVLGATAAVVLIVFYVTAGQGTQQETTRLMRDLGFNLRIIPRDTDMDRFWATGFSDTTMPEEYVRRLASQKGLNYTHLLPTLKRRIRWGERDVILVGIAPEVSPVDHKKPPMSFALEPGTVVLGHQLGSASPPGAVAAIELLGKTFRVARTLPESGTDQDGSIFANLHDAQELLGLQGRIHEIQALDCLCLDRSKDSLDLLREQLSLALPEARVLQIRTMAGARERQRRMIDDYLLVGIPIVTVLAAAWIGLLALTNVRERWQEIGVHRALGHGSGKIWSLFLGRAILVGILGAGLGFLIGTLLALEVGPRVFPVTGSRIQPLYDVLGWSLALAPAVAAIAAFLPAVVAVTQDPAVVLREQ